MNKGLFEDDGADQQFMSPTSTQNVLQKKPRPKFTMLDDIEELNEIINGPGANEQNLKAQEVLQKTYQYMKSHENPPDNPSDFNSSKSRTSNKESRKKQQGKDNDQKENKDIVNLSKYNGSQLQEELKYIKGPRIVMTMKKINLLEESRSTDFYVRGLQNLAGPDSNNDGTRAPTNSMRQDNETLLFTKALQDTERNKQSQVNLPSKTQKTQNQPSMKR